MCKPKVLQKLSLFNNAEIPGTCEELSIAQIL
jgi:hypothetical protein